MISQRVEVGSIPNASDNPKKGVLADTVGYQNVTPIDIFNYDAEQMNNFLIAALGTTKLPFQTIIKQLNQEYPKQYKSYNSIMNKLPRLNIKIKDIYEKYSIMPPTKVNNDAINRLKNLTPVEFGIELDNLVSNKKCNPSEFYTYYEISSQAFRGIYKSKFETTKTDKHQNPKVTKIDEIYVAVNILTNEDFIDRFTSRQAIKAWASSKKLAKRTTCEVVPVVLKSKPSLIDLINQLPETQKGFNYLKKMLNSEKKQNGDNAKQEVFTKLNNAFKTNEEFFEAGKKKPAQIAKDLKIDLTHKYIIGLYFGEKKAYLKYLLSQNPSSQDSLLTARKFDPNNPSTNLNDTDPDVLVKAEPSKKLHGDTVVNINNDASESKEEILIPGNCSLEGYPWSQRHFGISGNSSPSISELMKGDEQESRSDEIYNASAGENSGLGFKARFVKGHRSLNNTSQVCRYSLFERGGSLQTITQKGGSLQEVGDSEQQGNDSQSNCSNSSP